MIRGQEAVGHATFLSLIIDAQHRFRVNMSKCCLDLMFDPSKEFFAAPSRRWEFRLTEMTRKVREKRLRRKGPLAESSSLLRL
jgi:hypothetical protein